MSGTGLSSDQQVTTPPLFGLSLSDWGWTWRRALVAGFVVYWITVWVSYFLMNCALENATLNELAGFDRPISLASLSETSKRMAGRFGVDAEPAATWLEAALKHLDDTRSTTPINQIPGSVIVSELLLDGGRCGDCGDDCRKLVQEAFLKKLGGWRGDLQSESATLSIVRGLTPGSTAGDIKVACAMIRKGSPSAPAGGVLDQAYDAIKGSIKRTLPLAAPALAEQLLGSAACDSSASDSDGRCLLMTRLLQSIVDADSVRERRSLLVNLFFGFERLLIWCLVSASLIALGTHANKAEPYARRVAYIRRLIDRNVGKSVPAENILHQCSDADTKLLINRPGTGIDPIVDLLDAAEHDMTQRASSSPSTTASTTTLYLERVSRDRLSIDTMVAMFPVIGFVATLLGLIDALASANMIATTTGGQRSAAIMVVTSSLSSCFSTTLIALICMALFSIANMIQGQREVGLLRELELRLSELVLDYNEEYLRKQQAIEQGNRPAQ